MFKQKSFELIKLNRAKQNLGNNSRAQLGIRKASNEARKSSIEYRRILFLLEKHDSDLDYLREVTIH